MLSSNSRPPLLKIFPSVHLPPSDTSFTRPECIFKEPGVLYEYHQVYTSLSSITQSSTLPPSPAKDF